MVWSRPVVPSPPLDIVLLSFYNFRMKKEQVFRLLHEEVQVQSALSEAAVRRAMAAPTPDLRLAWSQAFIRLTDAMIATASAVTALTEPPRSRRPSLPPAGIAPLAGGGGGPPTPRRFSENNLRRNIQ